MADLDPRTPVLVGVGTTAGDLEAVDLMVAATRAAAADAAGDDGATALLAGVQRIVVPRGTWSYTDPARIVGLRIGARDAETHLADVGISQQALINDVLAAILAGDLDVAVVTGGEAKARAARAAKRSQAGDAAGIAQAVGHRGVHEGEAIEVDQQGAEPDVHHVPGADIVARPEIDAGLWAPVEQYALMESALRAAEGRSIGEDRADIAALHARFNAVAQRNPEAAFPAPMSAEQIAELGPANRPLAFPYGKWHASQWTVDQGAALILCSVAAATAAGVPRDRWVFPLVGVESNLMVPLTERVELHRWPAMRVLGRAAAARMGRPLADCRHVDLYSCFPVAVRVQQRELGLPLDATPTLTGGMAFAGGPFNSYVLHSTAEAARRLRVEPGLALVTTVSGLLTKPGLAVWASEPDGLPPLVADLADDARAATATTEVLGGHDGEATVVAVTTTYLGQVAHEVVAVLATDDGPRVIAKSTDPALLQAATTEELVGRRLTVAGNALTTT
ncbi:acetyl-CoA acetyltransferase [soil metagenome]